MKKPLFSIVTLLILLLGSCQESTYVEDIQEASSSSKESLINFNNKIDDGIVTRLQAYNDSLINHTETINSANGTLSKPWVKVALADAFGFCEGAAIGMTIGAAGGPLSSAIGGLVSGTCFGAYRSYLAAYPDFQTSTSDYSQYLSAYIKMKEDRIPFSDHYPKIISLNLPERKKGLQISGALHNIILDLSLIPI